MVFHNYRFKIAFSQLKKTRYNSYRRVYRIHEKEVFEKSYHSYVDVEAVRKMKKGIRYVTKYLLKYASETQTQVLTLMLCWLLRKQSFAVSGYLKELMQTFMASSHLRLRALTSCIIHLLWWFDLTEDMVKIDSFA